MGHEEWTPPEWVYTKGRPANDDTYFENLTRVIFAAGLNWNVIDSKWKNFGKAFGNFSAEKVAKFDEGDVERLMSDSSIVRNKAKIVATIANAKQVLSIKKECGSFKAFLDSLDKSDNYKNVTKELEKRFSHVGQSTAETFLWSVGEGIELHWE